MLLNLIITGVGGQGNVLASQIVGKAAVQKGLTVTIGETFGLSQRGGPVMSHIRISDKGHYAPLIPPNSTHIIMGLEPLETLRIIKDFAGPDTIFLVNSRPIYPLNVISGDVRYPKLSDIKRIITQLGKRVFWFDATSIALSLGNHILMNMVMIGALCGLDIFPLKIGDIGTVIKDIFPEAKIELNLEALRRGEELTKNEN